MLNHIINKLAIIYNGEPWFGNSITKTLEQVSFTQVNNSPESKHSIAQILAHIIVWRQYVIEQLKGNYDFNIKLNSELDWSTLNIQTPEDWQLLRKHLADTQSQLLQLIPLLSNEQLTQIIPQSKYTYQTLLDGLIDHDLYHIGQIAYLKKLAD